MSERKVNLSPKTFRRLEILSFFLSIKHNKRITKKGYVEKLIDESFKKYKSMLPKGFVYE